MRLSEHNTDHICGELHAWARSLPRYQFPFDESKIPTDGIYVLFEKGERAHGGVRIVRVGTHTGGGQLLSRLRQHFIVENKDRSIFRKNIGRALLNKKHDPYATVWELDMTPALMRASKGHLLNLRKQVRIEKEVTVYVQKNFSFVVVPIADKEKRLMLESKIISTLSHCSAGKASKQWLGNYSPKAKIRDSGLWLVNELYKQPLTQKELQLLMRYH